MPRSYRVSPPPSTDNQALDFWLSQVADALNRLPAFSIFSGNPNTSGVTADAGTLGFNIGSTGSVFYSNRSGTTNSWISLV